jgi:hypothetical protein
MSRGEYWRQIIRRELSGKTALSVAVTLRSSVRFAGKVHSAPIDGMLILLRTSNNVDRSTYVDLDEVVAIEVL